MISAGFQTIAQRSAALEMLHVACNNSSSKWKRKSLVLTVPYRSVGVEIEIITYSSGKPSHKIGIV